MPVSKNYLKSIGELSAAGKHKCYQCEHSNEGFCKPLKKFSYQVTNSECDRVKSGRLINFEYRKITKEFIMDLIKKSNITINQFCRNLGLGNSSVISLQNDKPLTTIQQKMYCDKLNKYF